MAERTSLRELAGLFFRLGATAFGGPAAHIALMQDEVVRRRAWMSDETFLDLLGATNLIPGPNSTEMAIHIGWARRRWAGLVVAGVCFIVPALLLTAAAGHLYVRYRALPSVGWLLYGVKPVMLAVVVQAIWTLAPKAAKTPVLRAITLLACVAAWLGVHELVVLFGAGVLLLALVRGRRAESGGALLLAPLTAAAPVTGVAATKPALFWVFLKIGSVLYGSGYVLLAFLQRELVERLHWLSSGELIDAITVGQVTPGPVFTTATFIGYLLGGPGGAGAATAGIFLPSFVFVALSGPLVPKLRASRAAGAFLDGVNAASLALMAVVTVQLARAAISDAYTLMLGVAGAVLLVRYRVNSTWLVLGAAAVGYALHALGLA